MPDIRSRLVKEIPRLRRYARALNRDVTAANDLVQDCLVRAVSKSHLWQEGTDLRAWLFTILHNQHIIDVRRAVRAGGTTAISDIEPKSALTSAPDQDKRLELRDLERAFDKLPDEQRSALLLVAMEGMNYDQAAAVSRRADRHHPLAAVARPRGIARADGPWDRAGGNRARRRRARPAPPSCLMMVTPPDRPVRRQRANPKTVARK
jgi:RNA polymerase sigma-70 factor, ECF subfamily